MTAKHPDNRCVNIDWLEVYCLESRKYFPCNADFFRDRGYHVRERDYGTRQYNEMFTIEDEYGNAWIEIRRNPASGASSFCGFVPESCHVRLANRACYEDNAVAKFRDFLAKYDYIFKRIFRVDICHDFEFFDSGERPRKFVRRYINNRYTKINQCNIAAYGKDNWATFDWQTLSWGSHTSMVSTKLYCKSAEIESVSKHKTYIPYVWFLHGLIGDPVSLQKVSSDGTRYKPEIWRVEFSLKSSADNWIVIEDHSGKRQKMRAVPHRLEMFDSKDKLWQRFEDLAYHYFHFKVYEMGKRKDRCKDKILYKFNEGRKFLQVGALPQESKPDTEDERLRRKLVCYSQLHSNPDVRTACDAIIKYIDANATRRFTPRNLYIEARAMQEAIAARLAGDKRSALEIMQEIKYLLENDLIF